MAFVALYALTVDFEVATIDISIDHSTRGGLEPDLAVHLDPLKVHFSALVDIRLAQVDNLSTSVLTLQRTTLDSFRPLSVSTDPENMSSPWGGRAVRETPHATR